MRLFSTTDPTPADVTKHPGYRMGRSMAGWTSRGLRGLADWLNAGQYRLGFPLRNVLLALIGLAFLLYFLSLLR